MTHLEEWHLRYVKKYIYILIPNEYENTSVSYAVNKLFYPKTSSFLVALIQPVKSEDNALEMVHVKTLQLFIIHHSG
jgi:hypothetical protein